MEKEQKEERGMNSEILEKAAVLGIQIHTAQQLPKLWEEYEGESSKRAEKGRRRVNENCTDFSSQHTISTSCLQSQAAESPGLQGVTNDSNDLEHPWLE